VASRAASCQGLQAHKSARNPTCHAVSQVSTSNYAVVSTEGSARLQVQRLMQCCATWYQAVEVTAMQHRCYLKQCSAKGLASSTAHLTLIALTWCAGITSTLVASGPLTVPGHVLSSLVRARAARPIAPSAETQPAGGKRCSWMLLRFGV
jgi:hypothetical protein